jgi:hypothetical protein
MPGAAVVDRRSTTGPHEGRAVARSQVPPGITTLLPGQTPDGGHVLSVLLKRSYRIVANANCERLDEDQPLLGGEVFWDTPMNSSVRLESDFTPYKLQTDVVLIGKVHAPKGRPAERCTVGLRIAGRSKSLTVTGRRRAHFGSTETLPTFSEPEPFTEMRLRYERAYGGIDVFSDLSTVMPYPRNPNGSGFVVANSKAAVDDLELPNIELPGDELTPERLCVGSYAEWTRQPVPAGFGWLGKNWLPRAALAGVMPADRETERELRAAYAKLVPAEHRDAYVKHGLPDMNFEFFNGAPEGQRFSFDAAALAGSTVETRNLHPAGALDFRLPPDQPQILIDIGQGQQAPTTVLHTVQIRMMDLEVDMVWRAATPYPGRDWLPQMRMLNIEIDDAVGRVGAAATTA